MKHSPHFVRHLITAVAIFQMACSALVSYLFVQENDKHISELRRSEESIDQSIRTLWDNAASADRNADSAVIVSLLAKDTPEAAELRHYYLARAGITKPGGALMEVLKGADESRRHAVDAVNDAYLRHIDVENEITARESSGKRAASIAFLLQLVGLVLIILTKEIPGT